MTHTPGPWEAADRVVVVTVATHGYATWIANAAVGGASSDEQKANARLIAAAPRLLAAGRALIDDVRRRYPGEELRCPYMRELDAAITEAERRS